MFIASFILAGFSTSAAKQKVVVLGNKTVGRILVDGATIVGKAINCCLKRSPGGVDEKWPLRKVLILLVLLLCSRERGVSSLHKPDSRE